MTVKYTPGPWTVSRENGSPTTGPWMIAGSKPGYLAEVRDCGSGDVEANARLIAAAPYLLAALQEILETDQISFQRVIDEHPTYLDGRYAAIARVAIQHATGETT